MRVLNFGSLNIDYVYQVEHMVRPGETLASQSMEVHAGGKGANQSAALGKAGVQVFHAGCLGADGSFLLETLQACKVNIDLIRTDAAHSGHAIIQVDKAGENCILLFGGGNHEITEAQIEQALQVFEAGDILLLQNEINNIPQIISAAKQRGLKIWFNPAPYADAILSYPLQDIDCFILNETEGAGMAGLADADDPDAILGTLQATFPQAAIVLTLGAAGVRYADAEQQLSVAAAKVDVVDTTAAGDTFIGYFAASYIAGLSVEDSLQRACCAAALAVGRAGAMTSVPTPEEVAAALEELNKN